MLFRCGLEDHWIADCPKPENSRERGLWNTDMAKTFFYKSTKIDKSLDKNAEQNEPQKIYVSMEKNL